MSIAIVKAYPPNIADIKKTFPVLENIKGVVYTYGSILFNPDDGGIDSALMAHETVHMIQQGTENDKIKEWWNKYLAEPEFRLDQELQAYQVQYRTYCNNHKDRNSQYKFLNRIASDLSSDQYGNIIAKSEAIKRIKNG